MPSDLVTDIEGPRYGGLDWGNVAHDHDVGFGGDLGDVIARLSHSSPERPKGLTAGWCVIAVRSPVTPHLLANTGNRPPIEGTVVQLDPALIQFHWTTKGGGRLLGPNERARYHESWCRQRRCKRGSLTATGFVEADIGPAQK